MVNRRNTRSRRQSGGMAELTTVEAPSMANAQGNAYIAARQQGGQAPVGDQGLLESGLRASAGVDSLDAAAAEIKGMQDGGRRKASRKGRNNRSAKRKASRKGRKNRSAKRKNRSAKRKNRSAKRKNLSARRKAQRGGAFGDAAQEVSAPSELLPADMQKIALSSQSADWKMVATPK